MKKILSFLFATVSCASFAQVLNGSFENNSAADLSSWQWTCGADSFNNAPSGGGIWSIKVLGGNVQGCFPGYAYQKIPGITNNQTFLLSGWTFTQDPAPVGIYFGKIHNSIITLLAGDTTSSTSWTQLNIQSSFALTAGDTAVVVLHGGAATGPVQVYGYFDLINLVIVTGVADAELNQSIKLFPNPFSDKLTIELQNNEPSKLVLYDIASRKLMQQNFINSTSLNTKQLSKGVYLYELKNDSGISREGKLVKE